MTLIQTIKIIEGLTGKTVTAIWYNEAKTQVHYCIDFGKELTLDLN
jgi:hypothetical protein